MVVTVGLRLFVFSFLFDLSPCRKGDFSISSYFFGNSPPINSELSYRGSDAIECHITRGLTVLPCTFCVVCMRWQLFLCTSLTFLWLVSHYYVTYDFFCLWLGLISWLVTTYNISINVRCIDENFITNSELKERKSDCATETDSTFDCLQHNRIDSYQFNNSC